MSQSEFAKLVQVSPASVMKWESTTGKLKLQQSSLARFNQVVDLTKEQAMRRLKKRQ